MLAVAKCTRGSMSGRKKSTQCRVELERAALRFSELAELPDARDKGDSDLHSPPSPATIGIAAFSPSATSSAHFRVPNRSQYTLRPFASSRPSPKHVNKHTEVKSRSSSPPSWPSFNTTNLYTSLTVVSHGATRLCSAAEEDALRRCCLAFGAVSALRFHSLHPATRSTQSKSIQLFQQPSASVFAS